jgi:hypothetical protein
MKLRIIWDDETDDIVMGLSTAEVNIITEALVINQSRVPLFNLADDHSDSGDERDLYGIDMINPDLLEKYHNSKPNERIPSVMVRASDVAMSFEVDG